MILKQNILLCLFTFVAFSASAQDGTAQQLLWSDVHITKEINESFSAKVKLSYFNTVLTFSPRFIDVGFNYQPTNKLQFGLYYRFRGNFETSCRRVYFETTYKKIEIKPLGIEISPRFRVQHRLFSEAKTEDFHYFQMRPRIMVKKTLSAFPNTTLFTVIETFHTTTPEQTVAFSRFRFDLGVHYDVPNSKHQIKVACRHQVNMEAGQKEMLGMLSVGYSFRF
ncbi:MAG: DUF2490 domain-containing protein [Saprospiraceae bacterium]|nr:DUF2490 domain-containing protein [Saprospiraceae bacterium]